MKYTTKWQKRYWGWGAAACAAAMAGLVVLTAVGAPMESMAGWIVCPAWVIGEGRKGGRGRRQTQRPAGTNWRTGREWLRWSGVVPAARSEGLMVLLFLTELWGWEWICLLPWVAWLWKGIGVVQPGLGDQPVYRGLGRMWEEAGRVALLGLTGLWVSQQIGAARGLQGWGLAVGMGMQRMEGASLSHAEEPYVAVEEEGKGTYHVCLSGTFELHIDGTVTFYKRMLIIFLGLLEVPGETRSSRRTRDGRTPFVRQQQMESWFGIPQPHISRWWQYWLEQDWERMLSRRWGEILTMEVRQRVIDSWALFPWWSARQMHEHLQAQGRRITLSQVKQIGRESGWSRLRQYLQTNYQISADTPISLMEGNWQ